MSSSALRENDATSWTASQRCWTSDSGAGHFMGFGTPISAGFLQERKMLGRFLICNALIHELALEFCIQFCGIDLAHHFCAIQNPGSSMASGKQGRFTGWFTGSARCVSREPPWWHSVSFAVVRGSELCRRGTRGNLFVVLMNLLCTSVECLSFDSTTIARCISF